MLQSTRSHALEWDQLIVDGETGISMNNKSRITNSIINLVTGIGGQLVVTLLSFITRTVFIHELGSAYLGINGLFADILSLLSLTELGLDTAMNFKLYKPLSEKNIPRLQVLMKFYKNAYRVIGAAFLLIGVSLIPALPYLIKDYDSLAAIGVSAPMLFSLYLLNSATSYLFSASKAAILHADQKSYIATLVQIAVSICRSVAQIIVLLVFKDFLFYTIVGIVFAILQNLITAHIAKKLYPVVFENTQEKMSKKEIRDTFKDIGALFVYKVNSVAIKATDNIVLSTFIGLVMVGLYSNYLLIYHTITSFLSKIYTATKASMGNLFATESIEKRYCFFEIMNLFSIIAYGTAGVGIATCADEVITCWLGSSYTVAQPLAILIGIEILFAGLKMNLGQIRTVTGLYRQMWFRPIVGVIINIFFSIALVFPLGIHGVIIGTICSDFFANFMIDPRVIHKYYFEGYRSAKTYYKKNFVYILLLLIVGATDYFICQHFLTGKGWISVIIHILICGLTVPTVFLMIFRKKEEGQYILSVMKRLIHRIIKKVQR